MGAGRGVSSAGLELVTASTFLSAGVAGPKTGGGSGPSSAGLKLAAVSTFAFYERLCIFFALFHHTEAPVDLIYF